MCDRLSWLFVTRQRILSCIFMIQCKEIEYLKFYQKSDLCLNLVNMGIDN